MKYEQKYKVGDRVVIKPDALLVEENLLRKAVYLVEALRGTDRVVVITGDSSGSPAAFWIKPKQGTFKSICIGSNDILGPALDFHEECEVSQDGKGWETRKFISYLPGCTHPCRTVGGSGYSMDQSGWKYVRRIQELTIKVTVEVNGEQKAPSFLSEETWAKLRK
jgi:hypothetical protein